MALTVRWFNDTNNVDFKLVDYGWNSSPNCGVNEMPQPVLKGTTGDGTAITYSCTGQDALEGIDMVATYATVNPLGSGEFFWFAVRAYSSIFLHAGDWPSWHVCYGLAKPGDNASSPCAPFPWVFCGYRDGRAGVSPESLWTEPQPQQQQHSFGAPGALGGLVVTCDPTSQPMDLSLDIHFKIPTITAPLRP